MWVTIILISLAVMMIMLIILTFHLRTLGKDKEQNIWASEEKEERFQGLIYASIVLIVVAMLAFIYFGVRGTLLEGHLMEWLNIVIRVMHVTFGIAWIGASFYFVFLENALNRNEDVRDELAGNLWAVHGGGFYYLEKYKVAPKVIPKKLHWFKYEAYFTWLSGFSLLFVVYYFNAQGFLVDASVMKLSSLTAISIGIGSFIIGWIIYDLLCKSPLIKKGLLFTFFGFAIAVGFAIFYTYVFSARAAYIHFGAMIGTLMAGNVFFVIIPAQKAMVKAATKGSALNPALGKNAGLRSLHNNYFTLPVLFVMVSNHFPSTFGFKNPWLILMLITLATAGIKHYLNLREKGQYSVWVMPVSVVLLLVTAFITAPVAKTEICKDTISYTQVYNIFETRCNTCHSSRPTDNEFTVPPNGVVFENPELIKNLKDKIMQRVVVTKTMPLNNKTGMTEEEREIIRCWIEQGGTIK